MTKELSRAIATVLDCEDFNIVSNKQNYIDKKSDTYKDEVIIFLKNSTITFKKCKNILNKEKIDSIRDIFLLTEKKLNNIIGDSHIDSMMEHEIKNILSNAKNTIELLKNYEFDESDRKKLINQVYKAVDEAVNIFDELLLLSKFNFENRELMFSNDIFDINDVIKEILEEAVFEMHEKRIQLVYAAQSITFNGSKRWMKIAIRNLIFNAIKYSKYEGILEIKCTQDTKYIYLSIKNESDFNANKEDEKKIFDIFYQSDNSSKGLGIGLTTVKTIIKTFSGTIKLLSEENKYITFNIQVPNKQKFKKFKHPIKTSILFVLLFFTIEGFYYPIIPHLHLFSRSGDLEILDIGKTILRKSAESSCFVFHTSTWSNKQKYITVYLRKGYLEADINKDKINFITPSFSFVNMGTKLSIEHTKSHQNSSVFDGNILISGRYITKGRGFHAKGDNIQAVSLLEAPKKIQVQSTANGLEINFAKIKDASFYKFYISGDKDFTSHIHLKKSTSNKLNTVLDKDGFYYLKIQGVSKNIMAGMPAEIQFKNTSKILQAKYALRQKEYTKAIKLLQESIEDFAYSYDMPYYELGWVFYIQGQHYDAIDMYKHALLIDNKEETRLKLSLAYLNIGNYKESEKILYTIIDQTPYNIDALWAIARVNIKLKRFKKAKGFLQKVLNMNPKYPLANYDMGRVNYHLGDVEAMKKYKDLENLFHPENKKIIKTEK